MATVTTAYGAATGTTIAMTCTSLANTTGAQQSAAVDNTSNLYLDALVEFQTKGSAAGNTGPVTLYAYGAVDGTTPVYTDAASGSNATITSTTVLNSKPVGVVTLNGTTAVVGGPFSVAAALGALPPKWGIIAINTSGAALSSTAGDHVLTYVGIKNTVA